MYKQNLGTVIQTVVLAALLGCGSTDAGVLDKRLIGTWRGVHSPHEVLKLQGDGTYIHLLWNTQMGTPGTWSTAKSEITFVHFNDEEGDRSTIRTGYIIDKKGRLTLEDERSISFVKETLFERRPLTKDGLTESD